MCSIQQALTRANPTRLAPPRHAGPRGQTRGVSRKGTGGAVGCRQGSGLRLGMALRPRAAEYCSHFTPVHPCAAGVIFAPDQSQSHQPSRKPPE